MIKDVCRRVGKKILSEKGKVWVNHPFPSQTLFSKAVLVKVVRNLEVLLISMGESNTVVSAYTMYRHLHQYCSRPSIYTKANSRILNLTAFLIDQSTD